MRISHVFLFCFLLFLTMHHFAGRQTVQSSQISAVANDGVYRVYKKDTSYRAIIDTGTNTPLAHELEKAATINGWRKISSEHIPLDKCNVVGHVLHNQMRFEIFSHWIKRNVESDRKKESRISMRMIWHNETISGSLGNFMRNVDKNAKAFPFSNI